MAQFPLLHWHNVVQCSAYRSSGRVFYVACVVCLIQSKTQSYDNTIPAIISFGSLEQSVLISSNSSMLNHLFSVR